MSQFAKGFSCFCFLFLGILQANMAADTLMVKQDTLVKKAFKIVPRKSTIRSMILPGWGSGF